MKRSSKRIEAPLRFTGTHSMKAVGIALLSATLLLSCDSLRSLIKPGGTPGTVVDELGLANRSVASFPAADEDYFADMDGGGKLSPEEIKGRNSPPPPSSQVGSYTVLNLGGAYRFWKQMAAAGYFRAAEVAFSAFNAQTISTKNICLATRSEVVDGMVDDPLLKSVGTTAALSTCRANQP